MLEVLLMLFHSELKDFDNSLNLMFGLCYLRSTPFLWSMLRNAYDILSRTTTCSFSAEK